MPSRFDDESMQAATLDTLWWRLNFSQCFLGVSSVCVNVRADFLFVSFLLLFSLGIPAWEVPPLVWGSLWHPAALLSFHQPAGCLWKVRLLDGLQAVAWRPSALRWTTRLIWISLKCRRWGKCDARYAELALHSFPTKPQCLSNR